MEKIGNLLKQKRLEMGLTIEEISEKTRLTIKHIKAIEEGDISYFRDDLSYLRFFLKAYCDTLGLDFEEMKPELQLSIEDYTTSFSRDAVKQHEAIERGVRENADKLRKPSPKVSKKKAKPKKARHRRKIDMSLLSFLAIVVVVLIGLIFAFVMFIQRNNGMDDNPATTKPPIAEVPTYTEDPTTTPPVKEPEVEKKELTITSTDATHYALENLADQEAIDIEITFGSNSSFRTLVNDKQLSDPAQKTYANKTVLHVREKAEKDKKIVLAFGFMQKNTIKVNGKEVPLPASITGKEGSTVIEFLVKGE